MYRKAILYLAGLACSLLLLSFGGCQSQPSSDGISSTDTITYDAQPETLTEENPVQPDSSAEFSAFSKGTDAADPESLYSQETEPLGKPPETDSTDISPSMAAIDGENLIDTSTALYTYEKMEADLHTLAAAYPHILSLSAAGSTLDGRNLYAAYFGNADAPKQIVICAATHGREYMTTQLVMRQLAHYCAQYETGSYDGIPYSTIFSQTCFVVVPMVNPDGVTVSQLGLEGLQNDAVRTNIQEIYNADVAAGYTSYDFATYLTRWKANGAGVDLNRNYSPGWESITDRNAPSAEFFRGYAPGDQPEAQALMEIVNALSNPILAISYHSYGSLVYWQYGQAEPMWSANEQLASLIGQMTGYYLAGYSNEGGFSNWCVIEKGIPSVTVETGKVPTPLPIEEFASIWEENRDLWGLLGTRY